MQYSAFQSTTVAAVSGECQPTHGGWAVNSCASIRFRLCRVQQVASQSYQLVISGSFTRKACSFIVVGKLPEFVSF